MCSIDAAQNGQIEVVRDDQAAGNTDMAPGKGKRASGPGNAREIAMRVPKARKGYRPRRRNAMYELAREFKQNQPQTTASQAWTHFTAIAETGAHPVLVAHDADASVLCYRPDPNRYEVRNVSRRSFEQQWYRITATRID